MGSCKEAFAVLLWSLGEVVAKGNKRETGVAEVVVGVGRCGLVTVEATAVV